jgi:hypothetical protein
MTGRTGLFLFPDCLHALPPRIGELADRMLAGKNGRSGTEVLGILRTVLQPQSRGRLAG